MKRAVLTIGIALMVFATNSAVFAEEVRAQRILLRDKSVIIGEIVEMKSGVYTIKSDAMGEFKLDASKILEISSLDRARNTSESNTTHPATREAVSQPDIKIRDGAKARSAAGSSGENQSSISGSDNMAQQQDQINARVRSMSMNGDFLNSMMDLSQDSNMMDVMSDPEIMEAISKNDYEFLMNSDKMKNLMDSQEIKDLLGDIQP